VYDVDMTPQEAATSLWRMLEHKFKGAPWLVSVEQAPLLNRVPSTNKLVVLTRSPVPELGIPDDWMGYPVIKTPRP
jgi:hypothetical protein